MRIIYPVIILFVLVTVGIGIFTSHFQADPRIRVEAFIKAIQKADYRESVKLFGGNACACPAKGGWVSYLIYASAQEPNLAFMVGQPFDYSIGDPKKIKTSKEARKGKVIWQDPEDVVVDVALKFTDYKPFFLPVRMAYGQEMSRKQLTDFLDNPDQGSWKGFTLRLRQSLAGGALKRPDASKGIKYNPTDAANIRADLRRDKAVSIQASRSRKRAKKQPYSEDEETDESWVYASVEDEIKQILGEEGAAYMHPRDPGAVLSEDGTKLEESLSKQLPRLQSAILRLHVVRRDKLKDWTVYHFAIMDPVLSRPDGSTIALQDYVKPIQYEKWNRREGKPKKKSGSVGLFLKQD